MKKKIQKKKNTFILCNFSVRTLQCFQKNFNIFFYPGKVKKQASKVAHNQPNPLFFTVQSSPDYSPQPRIEFSYYEISGPDISSLICGVLQTIFNEPCTFLSGQIGSKVNNKQYFHMKDSLSMKKLSISNFITKLLSTFQMDPYIKITKKFGSKVMNRQYFHRKTGLQYVIKSQ